MRQPIMLKLLIAYIVFAVTGLCIIVAITKTSADKYFTNYEKRELYHTASAIAEDFDTDKYESISDFSWKPELVNTLSPDDGETWIIDTNGRVIYSTSKDTPYRMMHTS